MLLTHWVWGVREQEKSKVTPGILVWRNGAAINRDGDN